jgi:hypothetical protein
MGEEPGEDSGFVRQRRNLMIVSLVLLFSEVADLQIEKLSAFGNELVIGKPYAINAALWVAGFYWLLRFYQYSRPKIAAMLLNTIHPYIQQNALPEGVKLLRAAHPEYLEPFENVPADPELSVSNWTFRGHQPKYVDLQIELQKVASDGTNASVHRLGAHEVRIEGWALRKLQIRAWIYLVIHTRQFTELILPYVLFGLPLAYWVWEAISR